MKKLLLIALLVFVSMPITGQDNLVLAEAYLLKTKKLLEKSNLDGATKYLKKTEDLLKDKKSPLFLQIASELYVKQKNYTEAKKYADLYFQKQQDKTTDEYNKMLLMYVDINEGVLIEKTKTDKEKKESEPVVTKVNEKVEVKKEKNYFQEAKQLFEQKKYELSNTIIAEYFDKKPTETTDEYQKMLSLKKDILQKMKEKKDTTSSVKKVFETENLEKKIEKPAETTQLVKKEQLVEEELPFEMLEEAPVFPGCEAVDRKERKKCLSENMQIHIARNFDTDLANSLGLPGGGCVQYRKDENGISFCVKIAPKKYRMLVQFKIEKDGSIEKIEVQAPHPKLKEEAIRIIKKLPKIEPGKQKGKPVRVSYNLPITFNVN